MSRAMLEGHPHLEAAKEIFYHRYWAFPEDMPREVAFMVSREKVATLGDLLDRLGGGDPAWRRILSLISNGHVDIDLGEGLGRQTLIVKARVEGHA